MKKRIFGMLLMGAMVIASMSMFTSCKDYDDDINANKAEIASLKAALQEQKTSLEAAIAAAKSEAQTANATLNTKLTELQTLVGNNKTDLENAIKAAVTDSKAYADGIGADALKVAKEYADAAAKEAAATAKAEALEAASKDLADLKALMEAGDDAAAKKASELAAKIDAVDESVNKLIAAEKEERVNALLAVNTQIENIKLQIAALEKFQATITQQVADIAKDLESTKKILEGVKATAEKNAEDIKANKEAIAKNVSAIADLSDALAIVDDKVAGLEDQVVLLKKADAELGTKIDNLEEKLTALITKNATAISEIDAAYKAADAALKSEFQNLLKGYYTKTEVDNLIKDFITSEALAPYAKTADVTAAIEAALAEQKTAMEEQITATLNAYDAKLAKALAALFGTNAEGAAAADVTMSEEAIKALEALKANFNNGINKQVEEQLNVLKIAQTGQLRSLVFQPDLYFDGIEAVEALSLKDTIYALVDETKKGDVLELWGVKGKSYVAVPDSALTTWYYSGAAANTYWAGPLYAANKWSYSDQTGVTTADIFDAKKAGEVQYYSAAPLAEAKYHINPSSADLEGVTLTFYTNEATVNWNTPNTRQGVDGIATPKYTEPLTAAQAKELVEDGILTVPFEVNRAKLNAIRYAKGSSNLKENTCATTGYSQEAFIALQANYITEEGADTTITSDYALLAPSDIEIVALEGTYMQTKEESHTIGDRHLSTKLIANGKTFAGADPKKADIASGFVLYEEGTEKINGKDVIYYSPINAFQEGQKYALNVKYNESVDLKDYITTHGRRGYRDEKDIFTGTYDYTIPDEQLKALGLEYKFEAIHYLSGSNKTDEYEHIELDGSVASPRSVTEDGKMISGEPATVEVVGRMPIVRATLEDKDGNVLALGYILLHIVDQDIESKNIPIDLPEAWMNCTAPTKVTWAQIEALVLREVGLSKSDFEKLYQLNTVDVTDATWGDESKSGLNSAYSFDPKDNDGTGTKMMGLEGRFYSKEQYNTTTGTGDQKPYVNYYGDAILYKALAANAKAEAGVVHGFAEQYTRDADGNWVTLREWNAAQSDDKKKRYPLGSVYETINTERQQTTVLEWNVGSEVLAAVFDGTANQTMTTSIAKTIEAAKPTIASKGNSTEPISVTVAYSQRDKDNKPIEHGTIYITLTLQAGDLHFAYAEITGKDKSLWYQKNSWKNAANEDESDAIEVHLNVPTPSQQGLSLPGVDPTWKAAAKGDHALHGDLFYKRLNQTFKNGLIGTAGLDKEHFSKFADQQFGYRLIDPKTGGAEHLTVAEQQLTGTNDTKSTKFKNTWKVSGVSGATYLLQIAQATDPTATNAADSIIAVAWVNPDGKAEDLAVGKRTIAILKLNGSSTTSVRDNASAIIYSNNAYAQDILNYAGRYAQDNTDLQMVDGQYLTRENKTFTAFISMQPASKCYNLFMPNSNFRVRWLRPINIMSNDKSMEDGTNEIQKIKIADMVKVLDWRTYTVTAAATNKNSNVHAPYYEINDSTYKHFFVDFAGIRTDHDLAATGTARALKPTEISDIEKLTLASALPSLSTLPNYFKINESGDELWYKNNDANVGEFHFYVPVYVCYAFGDYWWKSATAGGTIGNIHADRTARTVPVGQGEPAEKHNFTGSLTDLSGMTWTQILEEGWVPRFTQKVYAVITVKQTHQSHTGSARNK